MPESKGARIAVRAALLIFGSLIYGLAVLAGFYLLGFLFLFGDCPSDQRCLAAQEAARAGIWTFLAASALLYVLGLALLVRRWRRKGMRTQG